MSEQPATGAIPKWDIADRMRKSLRQSDMGVEEMAEYLGVARNTVSTWINGRIEPGTQAVRLWALRTGVPYTWLCHGTLNPCIIGPGPRKMPSDGVSSQRTGRSSNMHYSPTMTAA